MRNNQRLFLSALSLAVLVAGCGRDVAAPEATVAVDPQPHLALTDGSTYTGRFVIGGSRPTVFSDGVNSLYFPAGAVCDPATSSYGPGEWDKPCTTLTSDFTVTVTATVEHGRMNIDFSPNVRFSPSKPVWLVYRNDAIKTTDAATRWAIFYNPGDGRLIDEGAVDRSMITYVDRTAGLASRRVKHFSGFNISLGVYDDCTPYVDPYCVPSDGEVVVR